MEVWIFCVLLVCCDITWSFPTASTKPDSHPSQIIESIEAGENNTLNLIQEVSHSDLHTNPNPSRDLLKNVIRYANDLKNGNEKFQRNLEGESESEETKVISEFSEIKSSKPESLSLSRREALQQTDVDLSGASWSTMVLTIASTLVALFSMSVLVAVFQCCCRRRKRNSSPDIDDKGEKEATDDKNKNNEKARKEEEVKPATKEQNSEERKKREDSQEKTDEKLSFKDKLKAFEKKDGTGEPSLKSGPTPKKRPQSEAFKAFEAKGLPIMGMPMGQGPRFTKPKEPQNEEKEDADVTMRPKITITPSPDAISDSGSYKQPDNPDVVIADDDEGDPEFGAIKRETAVLRSYRKAPPPKNRNRSSAAFRRKNAQQSVANLFDDLDIINEDKESEPLLPAEDNSHLQNVEKNQGRSKLSPEPSTSKSISPGVSDRSRSKTPEKTDSKTSSEKNNSKTDLKTPDQSDSKTYKTGLKTPDKSGSKTPDKTGSKTPDKSGSKTPDKAGSKTPNKERSKTPDRSGSRTPEEKSEEKNGEKKTIDKIGNLSSQPSAAVPTGGNIFAQIDPTVKKTSPPATTPKSLETRSRADKVKSSPLFLEDDKLMKALSERLKAQQEGGEKDKHHKRRSLNTDL